MNAVLVEKLLGGDREWPGPVVVVLDAEASVNTPGPDSARTGGQKSYAPRFSSGRIEADSCYLLKELRPGAGVAAVVQGQHRRVTHAADAGGRRPVDVVALELTKLTPLKRLGIEVPVINESEYRAGMLVG